MAPRYLANPIEAEVLAAIEAFDPQCLIALERPLFVLDARPDADEFRKLLNPTLVSALSDKISRKAVTYVSGLGQRGEEYAMMKLQQRHSQLDEATRSCAKAALMEWRAARTNRKLIVGDCNHDCASGIGIVLPVSGALLHYDLGLAAMFG